MNKYVPLFEEFIMSEIDAWYDLDEIVRAETITLIRNVVDHNMKSQPWEVIRFPRLKKIWNDFVTSGVVRDEKGIDYIQDMMLTNTIKLYINTVMSGHTPEKPKSFIEEHSGYYFKGEAPIQADNVELSITFDEFDERTESYFYDPNWNQYRISDYAMNPLLDKCVELLREGDYTKKLVIIDQMLNIVHQRGDIASLYITGGSSSLSELAGYSQSNN